MTDKMNDVENEAAENEATPKGANTEMDTEVENISNDSNPEDTIEIVDEKDEKINELEAKLHEEENKLLRVLADYENAKRRAALDKEALIKYKAQSILTNLLPILDNFERALAVEAKSEESQSLLTGMEMIYRNLIDSLKGEGLVEIEAQDKEFDPNFHQAVMTGSEPDKSSGIVLEELQKGYQLKDRVLRPSMVKVNE
ncbi:protein GrpE [Sporosarcina luteola]|uniref:Protein GrpE n=1 Tax=Sporosarcina luteola TaxID=582850 RepID=A0A511ZB15_9BACL|nr:nucleotide exchange factor GrpE [Sporosarcina luteola]GEN84642.1 protein GrpE [Sporosarcina luteola]